MHEYKMHIFVLIMQVKYTSGLQIFWISNSMDYLRPTKLTGNENTSFPLVEYQHVL